MKKLIILTMTVCVITQSVWGKDCLSKETLQVTKDVGKRPKAMAYMMMAYEGRLNGEMVGLLKELKRKADAGDFDKDKNYIRRRGEGYDLYIDFSSIMSPDSNNIKDKAAHFEKHFGPTWGKVAFKMHQEKGDLYDRLDIRIPANERLSASIDEPGCVE